VAAASVLVGVVPATQAATARTTPGNCSWGAGSDPDAVNAAYPDTNATYWSARYAAVPGTKLVVTGTYPKARYFSFHAYHPGGVPLDSLYDAQLRPDRRSSNPFVGKPVKGRPQHYAFTVLFAAKPAHPAPNTMYAGATDINGAPNPGGLLMMRVYVPTDPTSPQGGVPFPTVTTETTGGQVIDAGDPCSGSTPKAGGAVNNTLTENSSPAQSPTADAASAITWSRAYGNAYAGAFGNQQNAYLTASISRRFGNFVVIHAKAPISPNTRGGQPAYAKQDMRYWSICQNSSSTRVNACAADFEAHVKKGWFTYVISDPSQRPRNANAANGVAWLPWGAADTTAVVIYRNMLVSKQFRFAVQDVQKGQDPQKVMGAYFPKAVYCDKATFERGGWHACFYRQ
jgi:hypothetical protein